MSEGSSKTQQRHGAFPDWMKIPFERMNQSTNFEKYACSPPDSTEMLGGLDPVHLSYEKFVEPTITVRNPELLATSNRSTLPKMEIPHAKISLPVSSINVHLLDSLSDGYMSVGNSSADVTPSGSPNNSPAISRRIITPEDKSPTANTKRWFYPGFFNTLPSSDPANQRSIVDVNKDKIKQSLKQFSVTNFDINAVGPTSW